MPRPKPDPEAVKYALAQLAAGHTTRDVAKELTDLGIPVKFNTIALWARQSGQQDKAPTGGTDQPSSGSPPPAAHSAAPKGRPNLSEALAARQAQQAKTPPPPSATEIDTSDTLGTLRELVKSMFQQAAAEKLSNPKLSATLTRSASDVLNTIARVEKGQAEAEDLLRISRKQIADARAGALERFKALCDRAQAAGGLLCARCSRQLSIEWGEAQAKVDAVEKSGGGS